MKLEYLVLTREKCWIPSFADPPVTRETALFTLEMASQSSNRYMTLLAEVHDDNYRTRRNQLMHCSETPHICNVSTKCIQHSDRKEQHGFMCLILFFHWTLCTVVYVQQLYISATSKC